MKIKDIMVTSVISVRSDASISDVTDIIFSNRFHGLPVVEGDKVIGIITEDDFFLKNYDALFLPAYIKFIQEKKIAENVPQDIKDKIKKLLGSRATDIMTRDCLTVSPEMDVAELMEQIKTTKFTTFPVTDADKHLLGIVTLSDILGTVKKGSRQMKRSFSRNRQANELDKIAEELDAVWNDNLVVMSKKSVKTWKGITFISLITALGLILLLLANAGSKNNCGLEDKSFYPLDCQKFTYSNWSACQINGTQTRELLEKLPPNCQGGAVPELVRPCQ